MTRDAIDQLVDSAPCTDATAKDWARFRQSVHSAFEQHARDVLRLDRAARGRGSMGHLERSSSDAD